MDPEQGEPKRTPKQEADIRRHLRRQKGARSRETSSGARATIFAAKGCGVVVIIGLLIVLGAAIVIFKFLAINFG